MSSKEKYLSIQEAADALGVSKDTIRRRIKKGEFSAEKIQGPYGPQYYIPESELSPAEINEVVEVNRSLTPQEIKEVVQQAYAEQQGEIRQEIEGLKEQVNKLQKQLERRDQELLQAIREKQNKAEENKPWWKRIFNKE